VSDLKAEQLEFTSTGLVTDDRQVSIKNTGDKMTHAEYERLRERDCEEGYASGEESPDCMTRFGG